MKIIGKTNKGFILEAEIREVAKLIGHRYASDVRDLDVGTEIEVSGMFEDLADIRTMAADRDHVKATLLSIVERLDLVEPVIQNLVTEATKSKAKGEESND